MPKTPNVRGTKSATRVLISWDPDPSAAHYEVQVSRSSGFGSPIENVRTTTTDFAPDLASTAYGDGGTFYWRVATIDEFNNLGAYSTGTFSFPKVIKVAVSGVLQRGQPSTVRLVLTDAAGAPVRGAKIRVTGRGVTSTSKRSSKQNGAVSFRLRPRRYGTVTFHVSRRGYQDAVATAKVY